MEVDIPPLNPPSNIASNASLDKEKPPTKRRRTEVDTSPSNPPSNLASNPPLNPSSNSLLNPLPNSHSNPLSDPPLNPPSNPSSNPPLNPPPPAGAPLSILPTLPLDILYETFGHLLPPDVLTVSRVSKAFRQTLVSGTAASMWKASFGLVPGGVPECPSDMQQSDWALLLFGGNRCQRCNSSSACDVQFAFRRRVCNVCLSSNLIMAKTFEREYRQYDAKVLDLVPSTNRWDQVQSVHNRTPKKYYWLEDVLAVAATYGRLKEDIQRGKAGAEQTLHDYQEARLAHVKSTMEKLDHLTQWHKKYVGDRLAEINVRREAYYNQIIQHFEALGYARSDVRCITLNVVPDEELTDEVFSVWRTVYEPSAKRAKRDRLALERKYLIERRKHVLREAWANFKMSYVPLRDTIYLPHFGEILRMPAVNALINDRSDAPVTPVNCGQIFDALPDWLHARAERLRGTMRDLAGQSEDLATSVFRCTTPKCATTPLIGWQGVLSHDCGHLDIVEARRLSRTHVEYVDLSDECGEELIFQRSPRGSAAVAALVSRLGIPMAGPDELDTRDHRFFCMCCPSETINGRRMRHALTWRQCVSHFLKAPEHTHPTPSWNLVDSNTRRRAINAEGDDPAAGQYVWECNHCPFFMDSARRTDMRGVIHHVRRRHGVRDARENRDFYHSKPAHRHDREPTFQPMNIHEEPQPAHQPAVRQQRRYQPY